MIAPSITWINGAFVEDSAVRIDPSDRGFTLGDGVFDTLLADNGVLHHADEHFARLRANAVAIHLKTHTDFMTVAQTLAQKAGPGRLALRTTITRGVSARGLNIQDDAIPTVLMRIFPAPPVKTESLKLHVVQSVRRNEHSILSRIKSLNYLESVLALKEAQNTGADDAILLNTAGHVCCTSAGNIFIVENGRWVTPPLTDGVLEGITRRHVMIERRVNEEPITEARLRAADGILVTNSLMGIRTAKL